MEAVVVRTIQAAISGDPRDDEGIAFVYAVVLPNDTTVPVSITIITLLNLVSGHFLKQPGLFQIFSLFRRDHRWQDETKFLEGQTRTSGAIAVRSKQSSNLVSNVSDRLTHVF